MAAPISAKSASWRAVAPMLAPRSSTMQAPLMVGHCPAMAGRSMPGIGRQDQLGHGHQGAGVAGRDHAVGLLPLHGFDRQPHAGAAAAPHRLARLVLHFHHGLGMHDLGPLGELGVACEVRPDARLVAEQQEGHIGVLLEGKRCARDHDRGPGIASHGVERDRSRCCHDPHACRCDGRFSPIPVVRPPRKPPDHSPLQRRNNQILGVFGSRAATLHGGWKGRPRAYGFLILASTAKGLSAATATLGGCHSRLAPGALG